MVHTKSQNALDPTISGWMPGVTESASTGTNEPVPSVNDSATDVVPVSVSTRTVQSKLPDPEWLERWLDQQIRFDKTWEAKVVASILRNLAVLYHRTIDTVQDLNRYRKELAPKAARATTLEAA